MNGPQLVNLVSKIIVAACAAIATKWGFTLDGVGIAATVAPAIVAAFTWWWTHWIQADPPAQGNSATTSGTTTKVGLIVLLISVAGAQAQTNLTQVPNLLPTPTFSDALILLGEDAAQSTNWVAVGGYGHSVSGTGRNLAFGEIGMNFNDYAGVIFGYDYLWGNKQHQFNSVKGGLTLQLPMHVFAFTGIPALTNIVASPVAFDQVATSSSSSVANILGGGLDVHIVPFWNLQLHGGADYENRSGDSVWGGNYWFFHLAITRNF